MISSHFSLNFALCFQLPPFYQYCALSELRSGRNKRNVAGIAIWGVHALLVQLLYSSPIFCFPSPPTIPLSFSKKNNTHFCWDKSGEILPLHMKAGGLAGLANKFT